MPATAFVALRHRNFRLIWLGLMLSFTGSMMQNAGLLWHVSLLVPDNKGLALGLVGLVKVVPIVLFSMISGVLADAWDRRKLMLATQLAATVVALALAVLSARGITVLWPIYALAALGAAVGTFDLPAQFPRAVARYRQYDHPQHRPAARDARPSAQRRIARCSRIARALAPRPLSRPEGLRYARPPVTRRIPG